MGGERLTLEDLVLRWAPSVDLLTVSNYNSGEAVLAPPNSRES